MHHFFSKIYKTWFAVQNWIFKFVFESQGHNVILKIILALTNFTSDRCSVPLGFRADFTTSYERPSSADRTIGTHGRYSNVSFKFLMSNMLTSMFFENLKWKKMSIILLWVCCLVLKLRVEEIYFWNYNRNMNS